MKRFALFLWLVAVPVLAVPPQAADPHPQPAAKQPAPPPAPEPSPQPEPLALNPAIKGETTVAPYRIVRLSAENVPAKTGVLWKIRPADPANVVDWASKQNVRNIEWVAPPGQYRVELNVGRVATDGGLEMNFAEVMVTIGTAPIPPPQPPGPTPPGPNPPQPPGPTPPAPIPGDGLRVLIVYESADLSKLPPAQLNVLYAKSVRDYLDSHCVKGPDGKTPEYRIWDQNVPTANEAKTWQDAMKRSRSGLPWLIVSNGKTGFEGPLPPNTDAMLRTLQTYGGP